MHVDYDNKKLTINCPKAYHTAAMLDHVKDIVGVSEESLSKQECFVRGSYVYSFVGVEVFEYTKPEDPDHTMFRNLMLTGVAKSVYAGEFMPEDNKVELTENLHINVEGDADIQTQ